MTYAHMAVDCVDMSQMEIAMRIAIVLLKQ